tara:strand:- start:5552 stop:5896 length:345 start_codon:yes stop_codon:yes gene_type:complete
MPNSPLVVDRKEEENWEGANVIWNLAEQIWDEFLFFIEIFGGRGKSKARKLELYKHLDDEKKKRAVKLICMVKGVKFEEEKEIQDFEVTIDDIDLVLERAKKLRPKLFVESVSE